MRNINKVLIIGSNSFAGATFTNHCLDQGAEVIGVSRSEEKNPIFLPYKSSKNIDNFKYIQIDINKDLDHLFSIINEFKPDAIIDFAGQGMVAQSWENPLQWYQTNFMSKIKLHEFLRKLDWLKVYMRASTPEVYGNIPTPATEEHALSPSTPYAISHAAIDMSLNAYYKNYNLPVLLTRSANFYGPGQQLYRIIPRTIIYAKTGRKLQLHGGGTSVRSFIYGDDFSDASWKILTSAELGSVYHLASKEYVSIKDLVHKISDKLNMGFDELVEMSPDRQGKDQAYMLSMDKVQRDFDWKNNVSLDQGIENTIKWVEENLEMINSLELEYVHKE